MHDVLQNHNALNYMAINFSLYDHILSPSVERAFYSKTKGGQSNAQEI